MLDIVLSSVYSTKEYQGWGLNLGTAAFFIIMMETAVLLWGSNEQRRTLVAAARAKGVSMYPRLLYVAFYTSAFMYALEIKSVALATALPILVMQVGIVWSLRRVNGGFRPMERVTAVVCVMVCIVSLIPQATGTVYGGVAYALVPFLAIQPFTMWCRKTAEGVNWRDPLAAVGSTMVWIVYAALIGEWIIVSFSLLYCASFAITLFLTFYYADTAPAH